LRDGGNRSGMGVIDAPSSSSPSLELTPTLALRVRPLEAFVRTCLTMATRGITDPIDIVPTLYFREGESFAPIVFPRDGAPIAHDDLEMTMRAALRDLAIAPEIDAYCAVYAVRVAEPGTPVMFAAGIHIGQRRVGSDGGVFRMYPVEMSELDAKGNSVATVGLEPCFAEGEPSWFDGVGTFS